MDCNKRPDTMARITTKKLADEFIYISDREKG